MEVKLHELLASVPVCKWPTALIWAGYRSRYSDWLRAGRSGDQIPVGGDIFPNMSRPALGPTQPPVQWVPCLFPGGKERPGRDADLSPPSSGVGHERVELYLYSPYGPYGLYRASVPVQGCTLPYSRAIPLLSLWAVRPVQSLSACTRVRFNLQ